MSDASEPPERGGTATRLLDAAESLFALSGFDAVTVRRITDKAGVPLGLLSYHFKNKEALFEAVIARRAIQIAALERPSLARLISASYKPGDLVLNHVRTYVGFTADGEEGWTSYFRLIAQLHGTDRWLNLAKTYFNETAELYLDALQRLWPSLSRRAAAAGWMNVTSVTCHYFAHTGRVDTLSGKSDPPLDVDLELQELVTFAASGLTAMLDAQAGPT